MQSSEQQVIRRTSWLVKSKNNHQSSKGLIIIKILIIIPKQIIKYDQLGIKVGEKIVWWVKKEALSQF